MFSPETGSILALDLPDLYLDGVSEDDQKEGQLEEIETTEGGKGGEIRHGAEENGGIEDVAEEELEVQDAEADDDEDAVISRELYQDPGEQHLSHEM